MKKQPEQEHFHWAKQYMHVLGLVPVKSHQL